MITPEALPQRDPVWGYLGRPTREVLDDKSLMDQWRRLAERAEEVMEMRPGPARFRKWQDIASSRRHIIHSGDMRAAEKANASVPVAPVGPEGSVRLDA